jgi:transcriptional regulator with XRE-family HTH domain
MSGHKAPPRDTTVLTPKLCKAARALLGWTAADLADYSLIGVTTIRVFESGGAFSRATLIILERAFTDAGIEFLPGGVVLRELEAA